MTETTTLTPEDYAATGEAIRQQIAKVIVGQRDLVDTVLVALLCEGHVLLEGVPGLGKTELLKTLGEAITVDLGRIQFTPDLMPADVVGTQVLEEGDDGRRTFEFRPGPIFHNLVLADEINRATPKTQSAMLEAMQERAVTVAGATRPLPRPFFVMATQNPIENEGTYPLPEAQLDRFLMKALVMFPPAEDLTEIVARTTGTARPTLDAVADAAHLREMIRLTREVPVAAHLIRYAVDLVAATHPGRGGPDIVQRAVRFGASPRGAQALILTAKAAALLDGRPNVAADDIASMARPVLRHRLVTGYEAIADGTTTDEVVDAIVDATPRPGAN
ncbi:MAG: MoxR family ATPase [Acidimicrobiales bacterium]|nr:MoxR family ATPase [Acidimicrobiales bacterium]